MAQKEVPGRESLIYHPSKVSWATADFVQRPPSVISKIFVYTLVGVIIIAILYSYFSEVAVYVETRGVLVTEQSVYNLKAPANMKVATLKVKRNMEVKKGEELLSSEEQLTKKQKETLDSHIKYVKTVIEKERSTGCPECLSQLKKFVDYGFVIDNKGQIRETLAGLQEGLRELIVAKDQVANLKYSLTSLERQIKVNENKLKEIRKQKAEKILSMQVEQLTNDITSAKAQIAERKQNAQSSLSQSIGRLEVKLASLPATLEKFMEANSIVAPLDGTISNINVSGPGQLLQAGQDILEIIPKGSKLVAEVDMANRDISQIQVGMEAKVKLDALPEREYGSIPAKVSLVPLNIEAAQQGQAQQGVYKVTLDLEKQSLAKAGKEYPFRLGMTLDGLIVTKRESLLQLGIKKLFNIKDDLFKE